jgi:hypothetical protein
MSREKNQFKNDTPISSKLSLVKKLSNPSFKKDLREAYLFSEKAFIGSPHSLNASCNRGSEIPSFSNLSKASVRVIFPARIKLLYIAWA